MSRERKQKHRRETFRRILISQTDLDYARSFIGIILDEQMHELKTQRDILLHRGLNTAVVVTYARPFTENERGKQGAVKTLKKKYYWPHYNERERKLHGSVLTYRNEIHAHSDSRTVSPKISIDEIMGEPVAFPYGWNPYIPLSREETQWLGEMIDKVLYVLRQEHHRLQASFNIGEEF